VHHFTAELKNMIYKRFYSIVILRVLLIIISAVALAYLAVVVNHYVSTAILIVLIALQTWALITYINRTNRKLATFFDSIRHSDFSTSFSDKSLGSSFDKLNTSFNEVINEFRKNRAEKEENYNYLQTVVQHITIGIICFSRDGVVDMVNHTARHTLKMTNIRNISELSHINNDLPETLLKLKAGDKVLIKIIVDDELKQLSFYTTEFRMRSENYTLVAFQDIHAELEEKEIESWQKLIRVLTHEIMNSITPISSLASTVNGMLIDEKSEKAKLRDLDDSDIDSIRQALTTIRKRSQGLLNFVDIYRNLTRIPKPNFRYFQVKECFERIEQLLQKEIKSHNIVCTHKVFPHDLMLTADPDLLDQVIINLVLNSIDAVKDVENPQISLVAYTNQNNKNTIEIQDNGKGIKPDIIDKIFFPFFTSKENGSGIGLSLSRQIMHLHKSSIWVKSKPGEGSVFTLTF